MSRGSWVNYGTHTTGKNEQLEAAKLPKYLHALWENADEEANNVSEDLSNSKSKPAFQQGLEDISLENSNPGNDLNTSSPSAKTGRSLAILLVMFCIPMAYRAGLFFPVPVSTSARTDLKRYEATKLEFTIDSGYNQVPGQGYPWLVGHMLAEPYKECILTVKGVVEETRSEFFWKIRGTEEEEDRIFVGKTVVLTFPGPGIRQITLQHRDNQGGIVRETSAEVHVFYVRRELRVLTDSDRTSFLDAMSLMYRIPQSYGQELFGPDYRDIGYFAGLYSKLTSDRACDHINEGPGFLVAHSALTVAFEKVLQLIDPAVTVPFWDYTLDASLSRRNGMDSERLCKSDVFSASMMGGITDLENGQIGEGRWAKIPMSLDLWPSAQNATSNAFGMLRQPWNLNPSPFLSRSREFIGVTPPNLPCCQEYADQLKLTSWMDFSIQIQGAPFAPLSNLIGGSFGACYSTKLEKFGYPQENIDKILDSGVLLTLPRKMWRSHLLECPETCNPNKIEMCKCTCPDLSFWAANSVEAGNILSSIHPIFNEAGMQTNEQGENIAYKIIEVFCNGEENTQPYYGDLMDPGSPLDPIFWLIHSTLDRLWQWKRVNGFEDESWPVNEEFCYGHQENDVTEIGSIMGQILDMQPLTNGQIAALLSPSATVIKPYIYDNFYWQHCLADGFPFHLVPREKPLNHPK